MDSRRFWRDLEATAKCPHCSETLKDPKTLPCLHSFCLLCLDNLARTERRRHQDKICCPICQTSIPIPEENTFSDLPTSFHLDRLEKILAVSNGNQAAITCQSCNEGKHTKNPHSVSVAGDGRVIVCDSSDALVNVLSPNGEDLLQSFGDPYLYGSPSFAVHNRDKFFVSYREEHRVLVFDEEGTFLHSIGTLGRDKEKLNGPLGLAIDKFNNLIVCDSDAGRLQVFTLEGRYVTTITGFGSPQFIAVSKDGRLYVVDKEKEWVHVLQ